MPTPIKESRFALFLNTFVKSRVWILPLACTAILAMSVAHASELEFLVDDRLEVMVVVGQPVIYADGEIDRFSAGRLQRLLLYDSRLEGARLNFNSPGGDLAAGIELGRVIREHNISVDIGRYSSDMFTLNGKCLSACAYAYLGGLSRYLSDDDIYGVHQFYIPGTDVASVSGTQETSAMIINYLLEMGVDAQIFSLASAAGPDQMITFDREEMLRYGLANDGRFQLSAEIRLSKGYPYLALEQKFAWGTGKLLISCGNASKGDSVIALLIVGSEKAKELQGYALNNYMSVDSTVVRNIPVPDKSVIVQNNALMTILLFDSDFLQSLSQAETFGYWFAHRNEIHRFGFYMQLAPVRNKVINFTNSCYG